MSVTAQAWRFRTLLTMGDLARKLNKPSPEAARKWFLRLRAQHRLEGVKVGREWRVDERDVNRVIEAMTNQGEHRRAG